jgi:competence protein CoiA
MYTAETKTQQLIRADQTVDRKSGYYCPGCKQPVYFKAGQSITPHFAHYPDHSCDVFSEGETSEHLEGKRQLFEWLMKENEKVEMEAYLPQLKQRPDLLWTTKSGEKIAIEFQCSSLPKERMLERTRGYRQKKYKVLWILGNKFHLKKKITAFQRLFFTELEDGEIGFLQYSIKEKQCSVFSQFLVKENQLISYKKQNFLINRHSFQDILSIGRGAKLQKQEKKENVSKQQLDLQRLSYYQVKKSRSFFQLLYEQRESIDSLPVECYQAYPYEWMIATYSFEWKYRFYKWVYSFRSGRVITNRMVKEWVTVHEGKKLLVFYEAPLVEKGKRFYPFFCFLKRLVKSGILQQSVSYTNKKKWIVKKEREK